ncbi:MAG: DUF599 domain-containing protein [Rickettsiales bacterium]|nr:DUF599 domain-containing protein [Rickettsiales bacterium]
MGEIIALYFLDIIALLWFLCSWFGYSIYADYKSGRLDGNIYQIMHVYRLQWMENSILRADKVVDINAIASFVRTGAFFASTSILIVAFLLPLFGLSERAIAIISNIPMTYVNNQFWEIKTMVLVIIFIYAFFKYTWSIRQYNYAIAMILATDHVDKSKVRTKKNLVYIERNAKILSNAARHFSMGIRAYYLGLVTLSWFLHPILFMLLTSSVIWIIYRREFRSRALTIMSP